MGVKCRASTYDGVPGASRGGSGSLIGELVERATGFVSPPAPSAEDNTRPQDGAETLDDGVSEPPFEM